MGLRVLYVFGGLAVGGAERNIVALVPHLPVAGVEPLVCTLGSEQDSFLADELAAGGCRRVDLGGGQLLDLGAARRLRALVTRERIDVVHAEDQYAAIVAGFVTRGLHRPFVITRHVLGEPTDTFNEATKVRLLHLSARFCADRVVAVSAAVARGFTEQAGLRPARVDVIHNGVDVDRFSVDETREQARSRLGWAPEAPTVVLVGVLREGKGHDVLLDAVDRLRSLVVDVQVKIVGPGQLIPPTALVAAGMSDAVELVGPRDDIPLLLRAADVLVQSSWSEGLPTVLIEAAAAGLPVVATDVGGTADIVEDGVTGWLVPAGDSSTLADRLADVLVDPPAANRMGARARERVAELFSLDAQAASTADLYRTLVGAAR